MKDKIFYIYYVILILIEASYQRLYSPHIAIRLLFLCAIVAPLLLKKDLHLLPAAIVCFLSLAQYTFAFPIPPTELIYYILITCLFLIFCRDRNRTLKREDYRAIFFYVLIFLYISIVDIICGQRIENNSLSIIITTLFFACTTSNVSDNLRHLNYAFISITLVICYWFLFCIAARLNAYNAAGGLTQTGWTDPNYLGCIIGIGTIISLKELLQTPKSTLYKILLITVIILSLITLLLNASRGAILAVSIASLILIYCSKVKVSIKILVTIAIIILLGVLFYYNFFDLLIARIQKDDGTGSGRLDIWKIKWYSFISQANILNWLFGLGYQGGVELGSQTIYGIGFHNDFIAIFMEYGFIGLIIFLIALVKPLFSANNSRTVTFAYIAYLGICSLTLEPFSAGRIPYYAFYFYILQNLRQEKLPYHIEHKIIESKR